MGLQARHPKTASIISLYTRQFAKDDESCLEKLAMQIKSRLALAVCHVSEPKIAQDRLRVF